MCNVPLMDGKVSSQGYVSAVSFDEHRWAGVRVMCVTVPPGMEVNDLARVIEV